MGWQKTLCNRVAPKEGWTWHILYCRMLTDLVQCTLIVFPDSVLGCLMCTGEWGTASHSPPHLEQNRLLY
jgi:hypothetical protein